MFQRLNVIITRAKCLLVIIGSPHTLQMDPNWLRLIEYCMQNGSFIQGSLLFRSRRNFEHFSVGFPSF